MLELLEGTGIEWKSLDSSNIESFSLFLLLLPVLISNLQVTIAKHHWTSRTIVSCRGNPVTVFDTSKTLMIVRSLCFDVYPFPFLNRNRNWSQRYCGFRRWSCFSNGFPRSIDSVTNLSTPFIILTQDAVWSNQYFNPVSIIMTANFYVQDSAGSHISVDPTSYMSPSFVPRFCVLSAQMLQSLSFCIKSIEVLSFSIKSIEVLSFSN